MKAIFNIGDKKKHAFTVTQADVAGFEGKIVHEVCATFTLAQQIEWATRQYVLAMKEEDEEGIGTFLSIDHKAPAFVGDQITIESEIIKLENNELICKYEAKVNDRLVAEGETGQKILKKAHIQSIFNKVKEKNDKR